MPVGDVRPGLTSKRLKAWVFFAGWQWWRKRKNWVEKLGRQKIGHVSLSLSIYIYILLYIYIFMLIIEFSWFTLFHCITLYNVYVLHYLYIIELVCPFVGHPMLKGVWAREIYGISTLSKHRRVANPSGLLCFFASLVYVPKKSASFTSRVWLSRNFGHDLTTKLTVCKPTNSALVAWFPTWTIALHSDLWSITLYTQIVSVGLPINRTYGQHTHTLLKILEQWTWPCIRGRKNEVSTTPMLRVPKW